MVATSVATLIDDLPLVAAPAPPLIDVLVAAPVVDVLPLVVGPVVDVLPLVAAPVVDADDAAADDLRNPISVSRNLWLLTIMVTECYATP